MKISKILFLTLILMGTSAPLTQDLYLTSLPAIADYLQIDHHEVQLTVTYFLFGLCISQLVFGPISDKYGRKRPLIIGMLICIVGGIICALANDIKVLFFGRCLQGLGVGSGSVISRIIMRDSFGGRDLTYHNSYVASASVIILAIGPVIGGYIQQLLDWHFNFLFLVLLNSIIICMTIIFYRENSGRKTIYLDMSNFWTVLKNKQFSLSILHCGVTYAGIVAWLTATPIILQDSMGYSSTDCKWLYITSGLCFFTGTIIVRKLLKRILCHRVLEYGLLVAIFAGIIMLVFSNYFNMLAVVLPVGIFMMGAAMIFPTANSIALSQFSCISGYASAILGSSTILLGMLSSWLISYLPENTQLPLSIQLIFIMALNYAVFKSRTYPLLVDK